MQTLHLFNLPTTARWRAKLCRLGNNNWRVFEEGEVYGEYDEYSKSYALIMENRLGSGRSTIFRSIIKSPVAFQKQESLLLWTGPKEDINSSLAAHCSEDEFWQDENGLARVAFAFQAIPGCALVSEFVLYAICQSKERGDMIFAVQQNSCINEGTSSPPKSECALSSSSALSATEAYAEVLDEPIIHPPMLSIDNLEIARQRIIALRNTNFGRELLTVFLATNDYLNQLWLVFRTLVSPRALKDDTVLPKTKSVNKGTTNDELSPQERIKKLWLVNDIVKLYIKSSDTHMVDKLVEYDNFVKLLSILEYDREFGARKANFCSYYCNQTGMKQVIDTASSSTSEKIQRAFRLKMLRDILMRFHDEPSLNIIRHLLNVYHADILESIQVSPEYCDRLFTIFTPQLDEKLPLPSLKTRDDAVEFVNELMKTSRIYPMAQIKQLYLRLLESGLVKAITYGLSPHRCSETKLLTLETLSLIMEFDSTLILPPNGTSILAAIVSMVYNTQVCLQDSDRNPSKLHAGVRAVKLESLDLLKKLMIDFSPGAFECFFQAVEQTMICADSSEVEVEQIIPILDMHTQCFSANHLVTSQMMIKHNIWVYLGRIVAAQFQSHGYKMKSPKLSLALIQLLRNAIMPVSTISSELSAHQVTCIIRSGIPGHVIKELCARPSPLYGAEQSGILNLIYTIVNGRTPGISNHLTIIEDWFINVDPIDLHRLCDVCPEFELIIPPHILEDFGRDEDQTYADDSINVNLVSASTIEEFSPSSIESLDTFESASLLNSTSIKRPFSECSGSGCVEMNGMASHRLKLERPFLPSIVTEFDHDILSNSHSGIYTRHVSLVPSLLGQSWWSSHSILSKVQSSSEKHMMLTDSPLSLDSTEN